MRPRQMSRDMMIRTSYTFDGEKESSILREEGCYGPRHCIRGPDAKLLLSERKNRIVQSFNEMMTF